MMKHKCGSAGVAILLWTALAAILLATVILILTRKPPAKGEAEAQKPVPVKTVAIEARSVEDRITLPAHLAPVDEADLAPEKDGRVMALFADKGDSVQQGQRLLQIDDRVWQEALRKAEVDIREAEKDLVRWQNLRKTGAVSVDEFDRIKTQKELAEIALDNAEIAISQCEIVSPIDGIVNDRQVEPGEYIHSGTPVFKVVNIDRLKLVLDIPERDITAISDGKHIPFTVNALPGQTFTGTVRFVAVLAARQSNAFRVEAHVENPDHILLPGMIARADVIRGVLTDSMVVPLSAIVPKKGDHVVFINDAGHALRRVVHIHRITGSNAILSSGLSQGDALIVQGHRSLVDGAPVRAVNE